MYESRFIMIEIGTIHTMTVVETLKDGYELSKVNERAFLPLNYADQKLNEGTSIDVFLYNDKKGRLTATMELPKLVIGSYDWVEVKDVIPNLGVFVSIGMEEEVLVSSDELPIVQTAWPLPEDQLYVTLSTDKKDRLLAIPATEKMF